MSYNKMANFVKRKKYTKYPLTGCFYNLNVPPKTNVPDVEEIQFTPSNDFERWFCEEGYYNKGFLMHEREDNHTTIENINYQIIDFKGQKYMLGSFTRVYLYNKLVEI